MNLPENKVELQKWVSENIDKLQAQASRTKGNYRLLPSLEWIASRADDNEFILNLAMKEKASFYGPNQVPSQIVKQRNDWFRDLFTKIVEEEIARVEALAVVERERVMKFILVKEEQSMCPICLDELPPVQSYENRHKNLVFLCCCGNYLCGKCAFKVTDLENTKKVATCPLCKQRFPELGKALVKATKNGKSKWLLGRVAYGYANGKVGLQKNEQKAREYYIKSAESGDTESQRHLACYYLDGELGFPKNVTLARKYAGQAIEKGDKDSYSIMAGIERVEGNMDLYYHYESLASYMGQPRARYNLMLYYRQAARNNNLSDEEIDRNFLLALYWVGKATETKDSQDEFNSKALEQTAEMLDAFIEARCYEGLTRDWIAVEPLTGYSHVPFSWWAVNKAGKIYPGGEKEHKNRLSIWKLMCANCGSREKTNLMICSRCKAFSYCSKQCQVKHWKNGHKKDCKGHWIESFFPTIRCPD